MKIYCPECKQPTDYMELRPKFCANCSYSFSKASLIQPIPLIKKKLNPKYIEVEEDYEDEDVVANIPTITPFQLESVSNMRNTEKLGNLGLDNSPKMNFNRPKGKKVSQKQFAEEWKQEMTKKGSNNVGGEPTGE
jgi:hypothetical protein